MAALPDRVQILVGGGGPAGMTAALSLFQHGFKDIAVVDARKKGHVNSIYNSRATVVHAGTLEVLQQLGVADAIIRAGTVSNFMNYTDLASPYLSANFDCISEYTKYAYSISIPQDVTEDVLRDRVHALGIPVYTQQRIVGMRTPEETQGPGFEVTLESGHVINTEHIITADGRTSTMRSFAGLDFIDPHTNISYSDPRTLREAPQFILGDVTFTDDTPDLPCATTISSSPDGMCVIAGPLPQSWGTLQGLDKDDKVYRIGWAVPRIVPPSGPTGRFTDPTHEELQQLLDRKTHYYFSSKASGISLDDAKTPTIKRVLCSNRFRTNSAIADAAIKEYNNGLNAIMFIGDAGHIHPPTGGQGMNLGIRDGAGLGPAFLAFYNQGDKSALANYATKRHDAALKVIKNTGFLYNIIHHYAYSWNPVRRVLFSLVRLAGSFEVVKRFFTYQISGLGDVTL